MNTTEILNKSLAWLYLGERNTRGLNRGFSDQLQVNLTCSSGWLIGFESNGSHEWRYYFGDEGKDAAHPASDVINLSPVAPQELYILTQIILHALNTEPGRFHVLSELPGLENRDGHQLELLACYLVKQGWIEARTWENGFLVKLSIQGKIFVGNHGHEAWA